MGEGNGWGNAGSDGRGRAGKDGSGSDGNDPPLLPLLPLLPELGSTGTGGRPGSDGSDDDTADGIGSPGTLGNPGSPGSPEFPGGWGKPLGAGGTAAAGGFVEVGGVLLLVVGAGAGFDDEDGGFGRSDGSVLGNVGCGFGWVACGAGAGVDREAVGKGSGGDSRGWGVVLVAEGGSDGCDDEGSGSPGNVMDVDAERFDIGSEGEKAKYAGTPMSARPNVPAVRDPTRRRTVARGIFPKILLFRMERLDQRAVCPVTRGATRRKRKEDQDDLSRIASPGAQAIPGDHKLAGETGTNPLLTDFRPPGPEKAGCSFSTQEQEHDAVGRGGQKCVNSVTAPAVEREYALRRSGSRRLLQPVAPPVARRQDLGRALRRSTTPEVR